MFKQLIELKDKYFPSKKSLEREARKERTKKAIDYYEELCTLTNSLGIPCDSGYYIEIEDRCTQLLRNIIVSDCSVSKPGSTKIYIATFEEAYRFRNSLELLLPELDEPATSMIAEITAATERVKQGLWSESDRISPIIKRDENGWVICKGVEDSEVSLVLHIDDAHPPKLCKIEDRDMDKDVTDLSWLSSYERHQIGKAIDEFLSEYDKADAREMRKFYTGVYNGSV
ncbi:hypothetical protein [Acinetobacter phage ABPH49]|nr:hypothetical protein [Acinetobacter phage ABPH49]